jgi:hypothetical protein
MIKWIFLILSTLLVFGCSGARNNDYTAGDLRAKNHVTGQNINWFKVNSYRAPGLGGGYCCVMLPLKWSPGLKSRIEWEVDPNPNEYIPFNKKGSGYEEEAYARHAENYQKHSTLVDIPQYGEERCGITIHFLPCNQVKVTTVCEGYGTPNYPIKEPMNMQEPAQCPQ